MCTIKNSDEYEHIIWESLLVGFVLKHCYMLIPFSVNYIVDIVGMIILTIFLSAGISKIYSNRKIDEVLQKIGIHRTRNKYLWKDIEDPDYRMVVDAMNPDTQELYHGVVIYYEEFMKHPQLVLNHYKYWENFHKEPIMDYTNDPSKVVIVDTNQFSRITISYDSNSKKIKRLITE